LVKILLEEDGKRRLIHEFDIPNLPPEPPRPDLYLDARYDGRYGLDLRVRIEERLFAQKHIDLRPFLRKSGKILAAVLAGLGVAAALLVLLLWGFGILGGQAGEDGTRLGRGDEAEGPVAESTARTEQREGINEKAAPEEEPETVSQEAEAEEEEPEAVSQEAEAPETGSQGQDRTGRTEQGEAPAGKDAAERRPADLERRIETIYFRPDDVELTAEAKRELENIAAFLSAHPEAELSLRGHTALFGTEKGRDYISDERAENTYRYLRSLGWKPEDDVLLKGLGGSEPVTMDPERQELNRRVEILIIY
jgi:outer membrane protein OmpA-like peptidoglycan-associated protein